jgi:hypothetical protein
MLPRLGVILLLALPCLGGTVAAQEARAPDDPARATSTPVRDTIDHTPFDRLLREYVNAEGRVDYAGLQADADSVLDPYLRRLATTDPGAMGRDARLAFWINAYNAYTLKLIVDHYPLETIWAVTPGPPEPKENSPFGLEVGAVADTMRTLDEIEHEIIRVRFDEPRIHFALVCAAESCPPLRREAYVGARLDAQLDAQARAFLHDTSKNRIPAGPDTIALTRILKWYGGDFGDTPADLQRALAPYFEGRIRERLGQAAYTIEYRSYDWALNDQARASTDTGS